METNPFVSIGDRQETSRAPMWSVLAQNGGEVAGISGILSSIISAGFAGFVAWYLLTRALPAIAEKQEKALERQQLTFEAAIGGEQATFERVLKEIEEKHDRREELRRAEDRSALDAVLAHCRDEAVRAAEIHKIDLAIVTRQLQAQGEILEDVRERLLMQDAKRRDRRRQQQEPPPQLPPPSAQ